MRKAWRILFISLLLAASLLAPGSATAAGTILAGQVTGLAGQALPGAMVELYQFGQGRVATATTESDGSFRFAIGDDSQAYWVRVWAADYKVAEAAWLGGAGHFLAVTPEPLTARTLVRVVDAKTGVLIPDARIEAEVSGRNQVDAAAQSTAAVTLTLPAGEGYQLLARASGHVPVALSQAALSGDYQRTTTISLASATGLVTGVVATRRGGSPLAGALVQIGRSGYGVVATAVTGSDGAFAARLEAGAEYQITASAPGQLPFTTPTFTLPAGGEKDFSGEGRLVLAPAAGELSGRLISNDGAVVGLVPVLLERKPFGVVATGETDADGHFRFSGLPAGEEILYRVRFEGHPGWAGAVSDWTTLSDRPTTSVTVQTPRYQFFSYGNGRIAGTVATADGKPVGGAKVELWGDTQGLVTTATTSSDGRFLFTDVKANRDTNTRYEPSTPYRLKVSAPFMFTNTLADGLDVITKQETVADIILYPTQVTMAGRVMDDYGDPVSGAAVVLAPLTKTGSFAATSDDAGRWQVDGLDPLTSYRMDATADDHVAGAVPAALPDPSGLGARDLTLHARTATLVGQVSNPDGLPLAGVTVTAWSASSQETTQTDGDGRYSLSVAAGEQYQLTATLGKEISGLTRQGEVLPVLKPGPGERLESNLTLWPASGEVAGILLNAEGDPVPGTAIKLLREGQGVVALTKTDANGHFSFKGVAAGVRYEVQVPGMLFRDADNVGLPPLFTPQPGEVQNVYLTVSDPTGAK